VSFSPLLLSKFVVPTPLLCWTCSSSSGWDCVSAVPTCFVNVGWQTTLWVCLIDSGSWRCMIRYVCLHNLSFSSVRLVCGFFKAFSGLIFHGVWTSSRPAIEGLSWCTIVHRRPMAVVNEVSAGVSYLGSHLQGRKVRR
jgi:hypothetical protein